MSISKLVSNAKIMAAAAVMAVAMALACTSYAFADTNIQVNGTFDDNTPISETVNIDNLYGTSLTPVYGMYYKSNVWNVLATTSYVSVESVLNAAISQYNAKYEKDYELSELYTASNTMTISVTEDDGETSVTYGKHNPTYADIFTTKSFFGNALNTNTTLTSSLFTSLNPTGAVLAKSYGLAATADGAFASTAATSALANESTFNYPRLITGCSADMTTANAMGKRYPSFVTGITIS